MSVNFVFPIFPNSADTKINNMHTHQIIRDDPLSIVQIHVPALFLF
jgi:hypothetical protein